MLQNLVKLEDKTRAGGITLKLRTHTALGEDPDLVHSTHARLLTTTQNSSYREYNTLFWTPKEPVLSDTHIYTQIFKKYNKPFLKITKPLEGVGKQDIDRTSGNRLTGTCQIERESP